MIRNVHTPTISLGKAHRLFVAVPLFALVVTISCIESMHLFQHDGSVVGSGEWGVSREKDTVVTQSGSLQILEKGTLHAAAYGQISVQAGQYRVGTWHGVMSVIHDGTTVTIAALTSPVLVQDGSEQWIIPVGTQWSSSTSPVFGEDLAGWLKAHQPKKLPKHYMQAALPSARLLMENVHPEIRSAPSTSLVGQLLQLPAAQERAQSDLHERFVDDVIKALSEDESADLEALIADSNIQTESERYPVILAVAAEHGRSPLLLPVAESGLWLQTAFHPLIRDRVWQQISEDLSTPARLHSLVFLPGSDTAAEALSELTLKQWMLEWAAVLEQSDVPLTIIEAALPLLHNQIAELHKNGFPLRARSYARTINNVFLGFDAALSDTGATAYEGIVKMQEELSTMPEVSDVSVSDSVVQAVFDADTLKQWEAELRTRLVEAGAMFMASSNIQAETNGSIMVDDVVMGTSAGDRLLTFTYDALNDRVRIVEDGKTLPNSVSLEKYLEWVKR